MINMNSRAAMYLMPAAAAGLGAAVGLVHHPDKSDRSDLRDGAGMLAASVGLTALMSIPKSPIDRFCIMFNPMGMFVPALAGLGGYLLANEATEHLRGS